MISGDDIRDMADSHMPRDFYIHGSKGTSRENFETTCENHDVDVDKLSDDIMSTASYVGYEVVFSGYWTLSGEYFATHVNGVKLESALKI